jgi:positive regulator of sigma E activity
MKTLATVVEIENDNIATVSVARHAACDGCHKNADGTGCSVCTLLGGNREARVRARNTAGAAVGDTVEVESRTGRMLLYAALVFLLPVVLCLAGYFVGFAISSSEGVALGVAAAAFVLTLFAIRLFSRLVIAQRLDVEILRVVGVDVPKG